jgi:hypothetical protein
MTQLKKQLARRHYLIIASQRAPSEDFIERRTAELQLCNLSYKEAAAQAATEYRTLIRQHRS